MTANKRTVLSLYEEVFNRGRWELLADHIWPDYVNHTGEATLRSPHEELRFQVEALRTAFPDLSYSVDHLVEEHDVVAIRATLRGTHLQPYAGIPATAAHIRSQSVAMVRFEDGRVRERWGLLDTPSIRRQLTVASDGIDPTPGPTAGGRSIP